MQPNISKLEFIELGLTVFRGIHVDAYSWLSEKIKTTTFAETCVEWPFHKINGYGSLYDPTFRSQKRATHVAYRIYWGEDIPFGMMACHRCDNPPCFNPLHVYAGTHADNNQDCVSRGRQNGPRGITHHSAKLDEAAVISIRRQFSAGGITQTELGRQFGVTQTLISAVVKKRIWKSI